ncbi:DUF2637 domain-containing protein [Streptomyces sp. 2314.4]|uniref:DUF2637 domain-containing protein n=1 Tax=Streptomyces sp. 2314.4 TaxID=1881025 RepID=UPI000897FB64|nr:DUF2637 domain-containing protein [Streptomyces sp. 2314.4]SED42618.1 Protein of unknown function [Streptomyces sp. 2314.4]
MTKHATERYALIAAGAVIVALTVGGFWLSYAHLAEVAGAHGLGGSPTRRWAWPATLDAFIVAGELLMLRAGLRQDTDGWAIALTTTGAVGSIALNVAGVSGAGNTSSAPLLDYVVAAVPPTAALLAFGVLMRQIHRLIDHPADHPAPTSVQTPEPASATPLAATSARPSDPPATPSVQQPPEPPPLVSERKPRGGRPAGASVEELVEIGRIAAAEHGKLTRDLLRKAVKDKGLTIGSERMTEVMKILKSELEADSGTASASG